MTDNLKFEIRSDGYIEMIMFSMPINEGMTTDHPGGLRGYLDDVGSELPAALIEQAKIRGAVLDRTVSRIAVLQRARMVKYPAGDGKPALEMPEYQKYCKALFKMTQCIDEFGYHMPSHTPNCEKFGIKE